MTFLNPAVLFGLIAAGIPILLHFLNLRKLKKIEFSTLAFLKELQKTKIRRIKFKQWLLLVLRVLIIIFLVTAFARPTIRSFSVDGSSSAKTTAVIVIDNTFSMSLVTDKGSYLNRAKQAAKSILNNLQPGDEVIVLPISSENNLFSTPTSNLAEAKKQIDDIEPTFVSSTTNSSLLKAFQFLYASKNFNKEVYILTDTQEGMLYGAESQLSGFGKIVPEETRIYLLPFNDKQAINLGVSFFEPNNQIFEIGKAINFNARVTNYSKQTVNNSVASLFINGKRSAQQNISLGGGETKAINFEVVLQDTGLVQFYVELEDDDILHDNKRFYSVYVPSKLNLLIVADNFNDSEYIKLALSSSSSVLQISEKTSSQISSVELLNYNALFMIGADRIKDFSAIKKYLENGGGIFVSPGSKTTLQEFQILCAQLNVSVPNISVGKINSQEEASQFVQVDLNSPLFTNIYEDKRKSEIESPGVYFYFKINPGINGRKIVSLIDNSAFISEYKAGKGKIVQLASAPVLSWNSFPLKAVFAPWISKVLYYCSAKVIEDSSLFAGNETTRQISGAVGNLISVTKPNEQSEYFNVDSLTNKNYLTYYNTQLTGTYKVNSSGKLLDYFSVNHNPQESATQQYSFSDFEKYLKQIEYSGRLIELKAEDDFGKVIYQSRFGAELWKYCLIIALLLAVAESIISRASKKDID